MSLILLARFNPCCDGSPSSTRVDVHSNDWGVGMFQSLL